MKKVVLLLTVAFTMALASCGGNKQPETPAPSESTEATAPVVNQDAAQAPADAAQALADTAQASAATPAQ